MKKKVFILLGVVFLSINSLISQVLYSDDFESYTVGQGIALQSNWWNTWTVAPGSNEDPLVSDSFAFSGNNSVRVFGGNDGLVDLNGLDSNRYRIEFYMYIPNGRQAYYNLMQNFDGATGNQHVWGMQLFFKNGVLSIDGAGAAAATYNYQNDAWLKMQHFIDLDNDWADIYINDTLVHAYQWSKGTFDDGSGIKKLDAINFYAWNDNGINDYFIDNFLIEQVPALEAPQNFAYQIINNNDVELVWSHPVNDTALFYAIARDGQIIDFVTNDTTYTDLNLYPNTYTYQLFAYYGTNLGYSASAGSLVVNIPGGNQRETVLFEIFTGTWCGYCPIAAQALTLMENQAKKISVIEYHGGDNYETPVTGVRAAYYSPLLFDGTNFGYPGSVINGMYGIAGALPNVAQHKAFYEYYYEMYLAIPAIYKINADISSVTHPYSFTLDIEVEETFKYYNDEIRLMVALTETNIPQNWGGLTMVKNVLRKMYPTAAGTVLDFSNTTTLNNSFVLELDSNFNPIHTRAVVFVQNRVTGHVLEAVTIKLGNYLGIETPLKADNIIIYPNPTIDRLFFESDELINYVEIFDIAGKLISKQVINNNQKEIDVTSLSQAMYILKIYTPKGLAIKKFIKE